jgi:ketosteroid isomerase-like protein
VSAEPTVDLIIDKYFHQFSLGNVSGVLDLFAADAEGTYPPFPAQAIAGGTIRGKPALEAHYTALIGAFETRHARATAIITDGGDKASSPLHCETISVDGTKQVFDNTNFWTFKNGLIHSIRVEPGSVTQEGRAVPEKFSVSLQNGDRETRAVVCMPPRQSASKPLPLLVFAHGWRVAAEDYDYLCSELAASTVQVSRLQVQQLTQIHTFIDLCLSLSTLGSYPPALGCGISAN